MTKGRFKDQIARLGFALDGFQKKKNKKIKDFFENKFIKSLNLLVIGNLNRYELILTNFRFYKHGVLKNLNRVMRELCLYRFIIRKADFQGIISCGSHLKKISFYSVKN